MICWLEMNTEFDKERESKLKFVKLHKEVRNTMSPEEEMMVGNESWVWQSRSLPALLGSQ